jgi:PAS domain S-box-containing protein
MAENDTRTILLVEDARVVAIQQRQILEKHGFAVVTATTGEDAVSACRDDRSIELVLMDIDLGEGIDGTEAARRILAARELPVVFLTGHTEREYVERVEQITRYGYVVKQAGELVLIQTIKMAFELFDAHRRSREQEQRFRLVYENMAAGVIQVGLDSRIQAANDAFCRMLGYSEEELRGRYISEITGTGSVEDTERLHERLQRAEVEHFRLEKTYLHKSGREIRGILDANIVRAADRSPVYYLGSVVDITDYRDALTALSRSEEKFRNIFDSTNDVILVHEMGGRFLEANEPACRYLGYSREELLQHNRLRTGRTSDHERRRRRGE